MLFESRLHNLENFDRMEVLYTKERMKNELLNRRVLELEAYIEEGIKDEKYIMEDLKVAVEALQDIRRTSNKYLDNDILLKVYVKARKALEVIE